MATRPRDPGEFCWINMHTPQPAAAQQFFTALLGWTFKEIPGMGHLLQAGGRDFGGMFDSNGPMTQPGALVGIGVMVRVTNADTTSARAAQLGGRGAPAFDVGPNGRMAECYDPSNANVDLWQPRDEKGTDVDESLHGAPCWFELMTSDPASAQPFYEQLFGWKGTAFPGMEPPYITFSLGERMVAGMMAITPEMQGVPPHWMPYFTVTDADATAREAVTLGASLYVPVADAPGVGRFCGIMSPQGVRFMVMQYTR